MAPDLSAEASGVAGACPLDCRFSGVFPRLDNDAFRVDRGRDTLSPMPNTALVNGIDIAYTDSGGDGPAVVLSHGYLMDSSMFDPQVAALSPGVPDDHLGWAWLWRYDGDGALQLLDSASDVLGLLDYLGIDQAVLGGMSQGGFVSLRAALLAPERVRALILIDSQAGLESPEAAPAYEQMEQAWME